MKHDVIFRLYVLFLVLTVAHNRYEKMEGKQFSISDAEYFVFHSPYNKVIIVNRGHSKYATVSSKNTR